MSHSRRRDERGSLALELAVLAPAMLLFIVAVVYAGRVAVAGQAVQQAAEQAARNASIARDAGDASRTGHEEAASTLSQQDLECVGKPDVQIDTSGFATPVGTPATVTATVTCDIKTSDLVLLGLGLPGTKQVKATSVSPLDTFRGR